MSSNHNIEVCPVCQVKIKNDREVLFKVGNPVDRTKLWARVCRYVADKPGCINQDTTKIGELKPGDAYQ
jgi:hypothetical protein